MSAKEYDIDVFGQLIADDHRMGAYARALEAAVKPGSVVVDLGAGTGIFALLACKLGARRVFAIEAAPIIQTAREIAHANGMAGRIEFHQAMSTEMTLPEKADVIVSDLRGVMPFHRQLIPSLADARRRFLADGGLMIGRRDTVWMALVESERLHAPVARPWLRNAYGLDMHAAATIAANKWVRAVASPEEVISEKALVATLDYHAVSDPGLRADMTLRPSRRGRVHGFAIWFDAELAPGIGFSNAPGEPELNYANAFFRWPEAVEVDAGDTIRIALRANLVGDEYVWRWDSSVSAAGETERPRVQYRQSTFFARPLTAESLQRLGPGHVPRLHEHGRIDLVILTRMAEGVPLGDIARDLARSFPQRFPTFEDAMERVGELSASCSL